ncbi:hypothetical protein EMCRGX_G000448 [Ephydatia muelleri]
MCLWFQFSCNNGNCISSSLTCNNLDDCGDNSDEIGCGHCSSYQFQCFNGQCVDSTKACNGIPYDCTDNSDESSCTYTCATGSVRLVGTYSSSKDGYGRVELCYNNAWGTICGDSGWNDHAAEVVCEQLGYDYVSSLRNNLYGQGAGEILLSGLSCHGNEMTLFSCNRKNSVIGITGCSHILDAGVTCSSQATSCTLAQSGLVHSCAQTTISCAFRFGVMDNLIFADVIVLYKKKAHQVGLLSLSVDDNSLTLIIVFSVGVPVAVMGCTVWVLGLILRSIRYGRRTRLLVPTSAASVVVGVPATVVTTETTRVAFTTGNSSDPRRSFLAPATGHQATSYQATGYQATGYRAAGYASNL